MTELKAEAEEEKEVAVASAASFEDADAGADAFTPGVQPTVGNEKPPVWNGTTSNRWRNKKKGRRANQRADVNENPNVITGFYRVFASRKERDGGYFHHPSFPSSFSELGGF